MEHTSNNSNAIIIITAIMLLWGVGNSNSVQHSLHLAEGPIVFVTTSSPHQRWPISLVRASMRVWWFLSSHRHKWAQISSKSAPGAVLTGGSCAVVKVPSLFFRVAIQVNQMWRCWWEWEFWKEPQRSVINLETGKTELMPLVCKPGAGLPSGPGAAWESRARVQGCRCADTTEPPGMSCRRTAPTGGGFGPSAPS